MSFEKYLEYYGIRPNDFPDLIGKYKGRRAVVCGDAAGVWDDLERLGCRRDMGRGSVGGYPDFITINKLVELFPGNIEHAYSNQGELLVKFLDARRSEYRQEFQGPNYLHCMNKNDATQVIRWPWGGWGTSGLGATLVVAAMGYDEIALCGVPLDDGPHNGEPSWRSCKFTNEAASQVDGKANSHWNNANKIWWKGRVTSMSGRTRHWFGEPKWRANEA